jgi:biopolymer transport protein ExbD
MSHRPTAQDNVCEPNLTPLLDVVLQLLMFFMMCVNFVTEQVSEEIRLPRSTAVKPVDKTDSDIMYINYKPFHESDFEGRYDQETLSDARLRFREGDPCVLVVGKKPMKLVELKFFLKQEYEDKQKTMPDGKVHTAIVIRADKDTDYVQVYEILHMCKAQGYTRLKLRAMQRNTPEGNG